MMFLKSRRQQLLSCLYLDDDDDDDDCRFVKRITQDASTTFADLFIISNTNFNFCCFTPKVNQLGYFLTHQSIITDRKAEYIDLDVKKAGRVMSAGAR